MSAFGREFRKVHSASLDLVYAALVAHDIASDRRTVPHRLDTLTDALDAVHQAADHLADLLADQLDDPVPPITGRR